MKKAFRLWIIKDPTYYINKAGLTEKQAQQVIDLGYDIDEDHTNKQSYIKRAKEYADKINKELNINIKWYVYFDDVRKKGFDQFYRYCSKCGSFFWAGESCECEE